MRSHVSIRALQRAVELLGSEEAVTERLQVSPGKVQGWLAGLAPIPPDVFLELVDVLLEEDFQELRMPLRRDERSGSDGRG